MERIVARYRIETPLSVEAAAAVLAGEQSSGTFVAVPGETTELKQRFAARLDAIETLESVATPSPLGVPRGRDETSCCRPAIHRRRTDAVDLVSIILLDPH
jgi:hypothetical protein